LEATRQWAWRRRGAWRGYQLVCWARRRRGGAPATTRHLAPWGAARNTAGYRAPSPCGCPPHSFQREAPFSCPLQLTGLEGLLGLLVQLRRVLSSGAAGTATEASWRPRASGPGGGGGGGGWGLGGDISGTMHVLSRVNGLFREDWWPRASVGDCRSLFAMQVGVHASGSAPCLSSRHSSSVLTRAISPCVLPPQTDFRQDPYGQDDHP
jgi:hypothetical protein